MIRLVEHSERVVSEQHLAALEAELSEREAASKGDWSANDLAALAADRDQATTLRIAAATNSGDLLADELAHFLSSSSERTDSVSSFQESTNFWMPSSSSTRKTSSRSTPASATVFMT